MHEEKQKVLMDETKEQELDWRLERRNQSVVLEKHEFQSQDEFILQSFVSFLSYKVSNAEQHS